MKNSDCSYEEKMKVMDELLWPYLSKKIKTSEGLINHTPIHEKIFGPKDHFVCYLSSFASDTTLGTKIEDLHDVLKSREKYRIYKRWDKDYRSMWEGLVKLCNSDIIEPHLGDSIYPDHLVFLLSKKVIPVSQFLFDRFTNSPGSQHKTILDHLLDAPDDKEAYRELKTTDDNIDNACKLYKYNPTLWFLAMSICIVKSYDIHKTEISISELVQNIKKSPIAKHLSIGVDLDDELWDIHMQGMIRQYDEPSHSSEKFELNWHSYCILAVLLLIGQAAIKKNNVSDILDYYDKSHE